MKTHVKKPILTIILMLMASAALATDYATLQVKAERFYRYEEWASALAMYKLMLDRQPDVADTYSHAIVAASMDSLTDEPALLLRQSMDSRVPLDSIYDGVRRLAFQQGNALLYERFLEDIGNRYSWMRRNIDGRLLAYYTWRRDAAGMVEYAGRMLEGMPGNIGFLTALADGYFGLGDNRRAVDTYNHILALDPENYHALLVLCNYYNNVSREDRFNQEARILADQYLTLANTLHATPYVTGILAAPDRLTAVSP